MASDSTSRAAHAGAPPAHASAAHFAPADALGALPGPNGERFATLFAHGTLAVEIYAPRGTDKQTSHTRDELYVVVNGSGTFWDGETRRTVTLGDLLFVAAGRPHRFEQFTDDLSVWVIFYGPEGGEAAASAGS